MRREIEIRDPSALRALAHPVRIRLLGLLRREGAMTASEAGRRLGESSGSTSYHLRQLARFDLVEEAGPRSGRERPWRATALFTSWPDVPDTPELEAASQEFSRFLAGRYVDRLEDWIERQPDEAPEWREAASFGDSILYVTVEELAVLRDRLQEIGEPYVERLAHPELRPPGARQVSFLRIAVPHDA
jgi:DNA-binding transcriptional ArsR family regulator